MSNTNNRALATLRFDYAIIEFVDLSMYGRALTHVGDLQSHDYFLSRVTSNPSYSRMMQSEMRELERPHQIVTGKQIQL